MRADEKFVKKQRRTEDDGVKNSAKSSFSELT